MRRVFISAAALVLVAGCAVIRTEDTTDASFKRHQNVALLGWPIYSRVTDRESAATTHLVQKIDGANQSADVETAEHLEPITEPIPLIPDRRGH